MTIFATKAFSRFARKARLHDDRLCEAAVAVMDGQFDADLGGAVFKQRVARDGGGKSGGFRTILVFRVGAHCFFVHGFAKSGKANVSAKELQALKQLADVLLGMSAGEMRLRLRLTNCGKWRATMARKAKSESGILASVHETVAGLHGIGIVDKATMREFDALCLTPIEPLSPEQIRAIREREQVSQPVFAHYLNVRKDAVSKWERGEKRPDGPSLKLLTLVKNKGLSAIA